MTRAGQARESLVRIEFATSNFKLYGIKGRGDEELEITSNFERRIFEKDSRKNPTFEDFTISQSNNNNNKSFYFNRNIVVLIRLNLALFILNSFIENRYNDSSIAMTLGVVANICSFAYLSRVMDDGKTSEPPQVIASRKDQVRANLINLTRLNFSPLKLLHYFSIIPHSLVNTRYFQLFSNVVDQQRYTILSSNEFH